MRRVVSVWFPTFPTDRLGKIGATPREGGPHDGRRRIVAAANAAARGVSREWGDDDTGGTLGRIDSRLGERGCDGYCG